MNEIAEENAVPRVAASGPIVGVVVHGRGAVVTRRIAVEGPLPTGPFDLVIGKITPLADPGSVRVTLPEAGRALVGVNARMVVPASDTGPGPSVELVESLSRQIDRLHDREGALKERVKRLQAALVTPSDDKALRVDGPAKRVRTALLLTAVIGDTVASIDRRIVDLRLELERVTRERDAAQLEDLQTSGPDRMGEAHPTRAFDLRIAAGEQPIESIELSYAIPYAAKWWPQYTLRLTESGTQATLAIEALVAQRTGEDWSQVPIGLSTASIIFDATLPKLPSLRLGKRQPPDNRGFREAPTGGEQLFESYDSFRGRIDHAPMPKAGSRMAPRDDVTVDMDDSRAYDDETGNVAQEAMYARMEMAPAAPPAPSAAPQGMAQPMRARKSAPSMFGAVADAISEPVASAAYAIGGMMGGGGDAGRGSYAPDNGVPSMDPGDDWLEFDSLVMGGRDSSDRGRLRRRPPEGGLPESELFDAQESARRMNLTDPSVSRGLFDYRYDSDGSVRIPADGRLHRIAILTRPAESRLEWRSVPLVDPAVYREAVLSNPFASPLLAGPVDVFSEGQLVTTTQIQRVDSGGSMRVGLGVDERIRIARNVRMVEESAGLLGGRRELIHDVEIELRSGLGADATVEVIDRVPVTSDDHVNIELVHEQPNGSSYDQKELDHPVEGGRRWKVKLGAGDRKTIEVRYQVTLRSKDELVGGNRRG